MSQEDVELARRTMDAFNAGDFEAATAHMADDIEWRPIENMTHGEVMVGAEGVRRFWRDWHEAFEGFRLIVEDVFEAPAGAVAKTKVAGRGAASGMELTGGSFYQVFEIRERAIRGVRMVRTRAEALAAAGVSE